MTTPALDECTFATKRLDVGPWHRRRDGPVDTPEDSRPDLVAAVARILTEPVTRHLPDAWHGPYTPDRARGWIAERDAEGPTLLAVERATADPVGLVILHETAMAGGGLDVRIGYLIEQTRWGQGLATELLGGLVGWCRSHPGIGALTGGVAADNAASRRVLEAHGFVLQPESAGELLYRLMLTGSGPSDRGASAR